MDCNELLTTFRHWSAVMPERVLQVAALWQTDPARSLAALWHPPPTTIAVPTTTVQKRPLRMCADYLSAASKTCQEQADTPHLRATGVIIARLLPTRPAPGRARL